MSALYLYRLPNLTDDLKRIRTEREHFKDRLEAAERRIQEYKNAADKENEQSSEIGKLKRELGNTGRELDEAKLRYREIGFSN